MPDNHQKDKPHKGLFYDSNTMPTDMGKLTVKPLQWLRFNWKLTLKKLFYLTLWLVLMIKMHWLFVFLFLGMALHVFWYGFKVYNTFKGGDVNPGKVISINPVKVAVSTNMTKGFGSFPAIAIIRTSLPESERVLGKIIVTAALYQDNPHKYPFWADFFPSPMSHATNNQLYLQNRLSRFSKEQIAIIDKHLKELGHSTPGIYQVERETSQWKNFPHVVLSKDVRMAGPPKVPSNQE